MALGRHHSGDTSWWDGQWRRHERALRITLALASALLSVGVIPPFN
jgi:hypothetical protein